MKILISGIQGNIGSTLGRSLVEQGHQVVGLSRNPAKTLQKLDFAAECFDWQHLGGYDLKQFNTVFHLSGENINQRWTLPRKKCFFTSRIDSTEHLISAFANQNVKLDHYFGASAIGIYGNTKEKVREEDQYSIDWQIYNREMVCSRQAGLFLQELCRQWELAHDGAKTIAKRVHKLRIGVVMSDQGGMYHELRGLYAKGLGTGIGDGMHMLSWVSLKDVVGICNFLLRKKPKSAVWNIVGPTPVTHKEFNTAMATKFKKKVLLRAPVFALNFLLGERSVIATDGQNASAARILAAGYKFKHTRLEDALAELK